ncbi:MAG: hypothetical protein ACJ789_08640 [Thermomicrobiales bacterium]
MPSVALHKIVPRRHVKFVDRQPKRRDRRAFDANGLGVNRDIDKRR